MDRKFTTAAAVLALASTALAGDRDHWAFQSIVRPKIAGPANESPIDLLIRAQLDNVGIASSQQASSHVLLRRLHLDLTGLLPTPQEIDAWEKSWAADPEKAYSELVERLLASPHFGERWARPWLDLARYADSDGYLGDTVREWAWVYRDWVIDAINRDQPYDQFSIEQLAGDLLPNATQSQKIATGFHRNNLKNTEAGSDLELNRTKQIVDRVATTGTTWLGLTIACAECHDHKHDPISQREYYQLYAFFNNTNDADISVRVEEEWNAYEAKLNTWEANLETLLAAVPPRNPASENSSTAAFWKSLAPDKVEAAGTELTIQEDGSVLASGKVPSTVSYFVESPVEQTQTITGFRLDAFGNFGEGQTKGETVGRGKSGEFNLSMFFPDLIVDGKASRLKLKSANATHFDEGKGSAVAETILPTTNGWRVATKTYQNHSIVFELEKPETIPAGSRLKFSLGHKTGPGDSLRHFQISTTDKSGPLTPLSETVDPTFSKARLLVEKHLNPPTKPPTKGQTLVERGSKDRRSSFIHVRGDYTRDGGAVTPGTPAVLNPLASKTPNRLDLAHWLFDEKNPLTARVAVNQIWQELFGIGIVPTPDDFGTYGEGPTHPELLDWLASEFRDNGWSRKKLIREIVHSKTYRQSSVNTHPEVSNDILWRQNSFRLTADLVRDAHLTASGLFSPKIGGPGIRPPIPEFMTAVGRNVKWPVSEGTAKYRRGMYIVLKRTVIYPMLTAFDAPDTSVSCSRREQTNTPMQALTLLNDPVFFECAETLGRSVLKSHGKQIEPAIQDLFSRCLNRPPTSGELDSLISAHRDFLESAKSEEMAMIATTRVILNLDEFISRD